MPYSQWLKSILLITNDSFSSELSNLVWKWVTMTNNKNLYLATKIWGNSVSLDSVTTETVTASLILAGQKFICFFLNLYLIVFEFFWVFLWGAMKLSITTFSITTLSIMTFSILTLSTMDLHVILSINKTQLNNTLTLCWVHYAECRYAKCRGAFRDHNLFKRWQI